jgi:transcription initiation factor TFIIIB Brf1 subunit/transcription initiation factor TFIIB
VGWLGRVIQGRKTMCVVAVCLYTVCREARTPHMLIDFSGGYGGSPLSSIGDTHLVMPINGHSRCLWAVLWREATDGACGCLVWSVDAVQINVYVLGAAFLKFKQLAAIPTLDVIDPSIYIHRFAAALELRDDKEVQEVGRDDNGWASGTSTK